MDKDGKVVLLESGREEEEEGSDAAQGGEEEEKKAGEEAKAGEQGGEAKEGDKEEGAEEGAAESRKAESSTSKCKELWTPLLAKALVGFTLPSLSPLIFVLVISDIEIRSTLSYGHSTDALRGRAKTRTTSRSTCSRGRGQAR